MKELNDKFDTINIITNINELIVQTEVTQYFKNTKNSPIELQMTIPKLSNNNLTKFEMTKRDQKVISKLIEKRKAEEKYTDTIASGNYGLLSYSSKEETTIFLGNIPPNEEITLKTYFFGHIISKDYSYQASFPVIFPGFILGDPNNNESPENYQYQKQIVKGKIFINTFSKLTRLVIKGSKNFGKIKKKYGSDYKSAEIDIFKNNFSERDIPGIIIFRTKDINKDKLFFQDDPDKSKNYYILQKTLEIPEFNLNSKNQIDEDENINYASLLQSKENDENNNDNACYIFLLDQSGSMSGQSIEICKKSLLLFLQSLNNGCYFQLIGFGSDFEYYTNEPLEYNNENITKLVDIIKNLSANKGGTELYSPLSNIYNNKIYEKFNTVKHIILLTDGEIDEKEQTLNLIGSHSDKFYFHSIGIGYCDKDLIERSALMGNGYSSFIDDLNILNNVIISILEKTQSQMIVECKTDQAKDNIEDKNKKFIKINDFFRHGIIIDNFNKNNNDIIFKIKYNNKNAIEIMPKNIDIINLPKGEELGKLIVDNYLIDNESLDFRTKIKLSKDYSILCSETAFYAEIQNEIPAKEKMITISNDKKEAINNNNIIEQEPESELRNIGYENTKDFFNTNDSEIKESTEKEMKKGKKKGFFSCVFSLFSCKKEKNKIINKKVFTRKEELKDVQILTHETKKEKIISRKRYLKSKITNNENKGNANFDCNCYDKSDDDDYDYKSKYVGKKYKKGKKDKAKDNVSDIDYEKNEYEEECCYKKKERKKPKNNISDIDNEKNNSHCEYDKDCCSKKKERKKRKNNISDIDYEKNNYDCEYDKECTSDNINNCKNLISFEENKEVNCEVDGDKQNIKILNFDDIILGQDFINGNWKKDEQTKILIEEEKDLFERIKKYSEDKGINDENGLITLLILLYIFKKKNEKMEELKFVINKAKNYIKKIYNSDFDDIMKELEQN